MKKVFTRLLAGFCLGAVIGNLIAMASDPGRPFMTELFVTRMGNYTAAFIVHTLLSALIGAAAMAGMSLYDETDLPLLFATIVHFVLIEVVFLPVALFLGWIAPVWNQIAMMGGVIAATSLLIWVFMFFYHKRKVSELNGMRQKKKQRPQ